MEIQKETRNKKKIFVAALLAVVLVVALLSYAYFAVMKNDTSHSSEVIPEEVFETDRDQSDELQENPDNKDQTPNTDHPTAPSVPDESGKVKVQVVASVDQTNTTVYIRGGINYPASDGLCYAVLSGPSNQSIRKESSILQNPASTDCKTISIPVSELAPGTWKFTLNFTSNEQEGASGEVSFTI